MKKQTAIEWLMSQFLEGNMEPKTGNLYIKIPKKAFEQAKAIEREQIIEAWNGGNYGYFYSKGNKEDFNDGTEYYNEVFKGGKK